MSWVAIAALGAFHGLNPAMGWLFAVALGQQEGRPAAVLRALPPIAAGHLLSVGAVVGAAVYLNRLLPGEPARLLGAACTLGFACWLIARRSRHPAWVGMRLGPRDLVLWSLVMTTAHGAGLMLLPAILGDPALPPAHLPHHSPPELEPALLLAVHTISMFTGMAAAALLAHHLLGLAFLRRGWINLDLVWIGALLIAAGLTAFG